MFKKPIFNLEVLKMLWLPSNSNRPGMGANCGQKSSTLLLPGLCSNLSQAVHLQPSHPALSLVASRISTPTSTEEAKPGRWSHTDLGSRLGSALAHCARAKQLIISLHLTFPISKMTCQVSISQGF